MTPSDDPSWAPSPELLAAYFDGEFEGRDELGPLRRRLEDWLARNPDACAELADYRRLRQLWLETTPPEPAPSAWQTVQAHLEANCRHGRVPVATRSSPWPTAVLTGAACLLFALTAASRLKVLMDDSPFPVASEREVVILHVDGADAGTIVVGELPLQGPLELVGPGDVTLTSVQPAQRDNMVPDVFVAGPGRPIIWARAEHEED